MIARPRRRRRQPPDTRPKWNQDEGGTNIYVHEDGENVWVSWRELEAATRAAIDYDYNKPDFRHDETYNLRRPRRK